MIENNQFTTSGKKKLFENQKLQNFKKKSDRTFEEQHKPQN